MARSPIPPHREGLQSAQKRSFPDPSLDHLVRAQQHRSGDGEAELLSGFQIDHQLELGRQLHRKISRIGTLENLIHVGGGASEQVGTVYPIYATSPPASTNSLPWYSDGR